MQLAHNLITIGQFNIAQINLELAGGGHGIHALPTTHQTDIQRNAALQIRQRMNGDNLLRGLTNRADAGFEITAGMRGLAFNIHH